MMTKQAKLKKQAYESSLKSRALSVLIYLIDRSNKELTCFPSISTVAGQLHISVSTVKRALRELEAAGYIKKDSRYRSNQGQTSNLYTLVLWAFPVGPDLAAGEKPGGAEGIGSGETGGEIGHVTFETFKLEKGQKERDMGLEGGKYQGNRRSDDNPEAKCHGRAGALSKQVERKPTRGCRPQRLRRRDGDSIQQRAIKLAFGWTGEGVSLRPP